MPDPFASNRAQEETPVIDKLTAVKKPLILAVLCMVVANALIMVIAGGYIKFEPKERPNKEETVVTTVTTEPPIDTGTAYSHVLPATGAYAEGIDRYIRYERSQMKMDEVVFSFVGDCTIGTWPESTKGINYNAIYEKSGSETYSFDLVKSFFENDDYSYINLETTLTKASSRLDKGFSYNFKGDPEWARTMLAASGVDGCNLANNHSYDWKSRGYEETQEVVREAGMDIGTQNSAVFTNFNGLEVVLLSANYITTSYNPNEVFGDELTELMIKQIQQFKRDSNIVVVNCHWGLERKNIPNEEQTVPAHKFVDAGADLVIGHHPHTLQGVECYKGKYIFYSIGNFAFGGKATTDEVNRISIMVRPRFALRDGRATVTGICVVPCYTTSAADLEENNYQPMPVFGATANRIYSQLREYSNELAYPASVSCPSVDFEEITTTPTTTTTTTTNTESTEENTTTTSTGSTKSEETTTTTEETTTTEQTTTTTEPSAETTTTTSAVAE